MMEYGMADHSDAPWCFFPMRRMLKLNPRVNLQRHYPADRLTGHWVYAFLICFLIRAIVFSSSFSRLFMVM